MATSTHSQYPISFPRQKLSTSQKNSKNNQWYKECVDAAEDIALYGNLDYHNKMQVWYDLDDDIINVEEIESVFNPMDLEDAAFPASLKNYPLSVPKIDLLHGEELRRRFDWNVRAKNLDVESAEESSLSDLLMDILIDELQNEAYSEEDAQKRITEFSKYAKYGWKSKHETTATRILQYLWREQDMQFKFNNGFRHALVGGYELYDIDIYGNEPTLSTVDPRSFYSIRRGDSERIEDSDITVQITYEPINKVIDKYYEYLKDSDVDALEDISARSNQKSSNLGYKHDFPPIYSNLDFGNGSGFQDLKDINQGDFNRGLPFDSLGNVRVVRARWISRKKVGIVSFFDPNTGEEDQKIVSEYYKINKELGETIKWVWVNEACEGTKIATDIYVKLQPREVQMRHFDNKSKCFLGFVGTAYGKSLMGRMEPYQYLYNVYMRRLEMVLAKYKGPIYELDVSKIPDDWEMDKWMYYADILGWAVIDNFNEGKKGAATGKLAGHFNTSGKVLDPNIGSYIQQIVLMLQHIEDIIGKISGVTAQREGQIENRETARGIERSVSQSNHITERWFFVHDETKKRAMIALLDTAKQAWKKSNSRKLNFVLDDMSRQFIEFNPQDIASTEYDLFITNSGKDMEIRDALSQLAHAAVQNGARMSIITDILRSESISEMARRLDEAEEEAMNRQNEMQKLQQQQVQQQAQIQQQEQEADRQLEYDKLDLEKYKADLDAQTKLEIANKDGGDIGVEDDDSEKLNVDMQKHRDKMNLESKKLSETIRSNKAKEVIAKLKPKSTTSK
jgi:uncharacterized protein YbcI